MVDKTFSSIVIDTSPINHKWEAFLDRLRRLLYPDAEAVYVEYNPRTDCYLLVPVEKGRDMWHIYIPVDVVYEILYEN